MSSEEKTPLISAATTGPDVSASTRSSGSGGSDSKYDSNSRKSFYFLQRTGSQASDSNTKRRSGDGKSAFIIHIYSHLISYSVGFHFSAPQRNP
jgi:type IV secretory pathway TrbL component